MLEDPTAPAIYRVSGNPPYPTPGDPQIPHSIIPRKVTLRDRITIASLLPFSTPTAVPPRLLSYLCSQLNLEIEKGDTYPMMTSMPVSTFGTYWFQNFGAIMLLGEVESVEEVWEMENEGGEWEKVCLGSFYVKPNYPGRSSHVCNGGFLVTEAARNKGVGRLMGEGYLEWAPKLVCLLLRSVKCLHSLSAIYQMILDHPFFLSFKLSNSDRIGFRQRDLINWPGIYLLSLQPRLRNQRSFMPNLGCPWLQTHRPDPFVRKPALFS